MCAGAGAHSFILDGRIHIAVDEVGDGLDGPRDVKVGDGLGFQVLRDAGHAVAFLNSVAGDGQITAVEAHQCDVGSVQRCDVG